MENKIKPYRNQLANIAKTKTDLILNSQTAEGINEENIDTNYDNDLISNNTDELYSKAVEIIVKQQKVSTSYIQRYLQIGYNRAARIIEKMEEDGIISEANNAGKRHVLKRE